MRVLLLTSSNDTELLLSMGFKAYFQLLYPSQYFYLVTVEMDLGCFRLSSTAVPIAPCLNKGSDLDPVPPDILKTTMAFNCINSVRLE